MNEQEEIKIRRRIQKAIRNIEIADATIPLDSSFKKDLYIAFKSNIPNLVGEIFNIIEQELGYDR